MNSLSSTTIKGGVSASALLLIDKYQGNSVLTMTGARRGIEQFFSSVWQNILSGWIRPLLPTALQLSPMFLNPVIVGLEFALFEMLIDGQGTGYFFKYNFIESMLAEAASSLISPSLSAFTGSGTAAQVTSPSISSAYT